MTSQTQTTLTRLRILYAKSEALRYTGHLDMHRSWERTLRRARLPLAYSAGFHPQPRIQQACALPLGFTSRNEIVDIWLDGDVNTIEAAKMIQQAAPPGIEVIQVEGIDLRTPALQTLVRSAEYSVELLESSEMNLEDQVDHLLESQNLPRERRGKAYDLRPLIEDLQVVQIQTSGHPGLWMQLSAREGATGRPEEVLEAMGLKPESARIQRTRLIVTS